MPPRQDEMCFAAVVVVVDPAPACAIVSADTVDPACCIKVWSRPLLRAVYEQIPHGNLVQVVVERDAQIRTLKAEMRTARKNFKKQIQRRDEHIVAAETCEERPENQLAIHRLGKIRLSTKGALALAVRRFSANIAAVQLGAVLMENVSHTTVVRCENEAANAFARKTMLFHEQNDRACVRAAIDGATSIAVHSFSCDATNTNVWHSAPLNGLVLESVYISDVDSVRHNPYCDCVDSRRDWADVQRVNGKSAAHMHAIILAQLRSLGCVPWLQVMSPAERGMFFVQRGSCDGRPPVPENAGVLIRLWLFTSDGGPDVSSFKKVVLEEVHYDRGPDAKVAPALHRIVEVWITSGCLMHSEELIVKTSLVRTDKFVEKCGKTWKYFSEVAKLMHTWRELARPFFVVWTALFGADAALRCTKTIAPRPVSGRWGVIDSCAERVQKAGQCQLSPVVNVVLARNKKEVCLV